MQSLIDALKTLRLWQAIAPWLWCWGWGTIHVLINRSTAAALADTQQTIPISQSTRNTEVLVGGGSEDGHVATGRSTSTS